MSRQRGPHWWFTNESGPLRRGLPFRDAKMIEGNDLAVGMKGMSLADKICYGHHMNWL